MIIAVDIGATKTLVAPFDDSGNISSKIQFATSEDTDDFYAELLHTLKKLATPKAIAIGAPGIIDGLGVIKRCGRLSWLDFDLKGRLQSDLPGIPILIENDAKLGALGEANSISPLPDMCLYLTVSTGIGEGVVKNGRLVEALKFSEAGHMMFVDGGKWQTWQDISSGRAIKAHFGKFARDLTRDEEWQWVSDKIALGLVALVPTLQPDVVVIGGSIGTYFDRFGTKLSKTINDRLPKYIKKPTILQAKHAEEAVIYGCYHYATHQGHA